MEFYAVISNHTFQRILRDMENAYHIILMEKSRNKKYRDFPSGPVVKTLSFDARGIGSIPGQGTKISQAMRHDKTHTHTHIYVSLYVDIYNIYLYVDIDMHTEKKV